MTVDEWLDALPAERASEARRLRALVRAALPDAAEEVRHGMAWYGRNGDMLAAFNAKTAGYALYLCPRAGEDPYAAWRAELPKSAIGKGCLNFRALDALPVGMVEGVLRGL